MNTANPALVVLAAGMGSRYGSLKQIDQFGPSGETIIDYTIYDAIRAGFSKVVFIIRRNIEREFKEVFSNRFGGQIEVDYVFQEIDIIPDNFSVPKGRTKPWGTGHAVLMAAEKINSAFAVVNADDFYGNNSLKLLFNHLRILDGNELGACLIGYRLIKTLSENGSVSRGICRVNPDSCLESIVERTKIFLNPHREINYVLGDENYSISGNEIVSMNLFGFTPDFFKVLQVEFEKFLATDYDSLNSEFYLPSAVDVLVNKYGIPVPVLPTPDETFGVTYQGDKSVVKRKLRRLVDAGNYPESLWKISV